MSVGYGGAGVGQLQPGAFGMLSARVSNRRNAAAQPLVMVHAAQSPTLQMGRPLWLPPRSERQTWMLFRPPENVQADARSVDTVALLLSETQREQLLMNQPMPVLISQGMPLTAMVVGQENGAGPSNTPESETDAINTLARLAAGAIRDDKMLLPRPMRQPPPVALGYQSVGRVILPGRQYVMDPAQMRAMRQWLAGGGTLWIMLDRVDPAFVAQLLGEAWQSEIVARTRLNEVHIAPGPDASNDFKPTHTTFETPVDFVQVWPQPDASVLSAQGDWPAAFAIPYDQGQVLVTTVGPRGWVQQVKPKSTADKPVYETTAALKQLAYVFHRHLVSDTFALASQGERSAVQVEDVAFEPMLMELIGYGVASRSLIAALLVGYCVVFLIIAVVLWRLQRQAWIGLAGLALAVVTAGLILAAGAVSRQSTPQTVASVAVGEVHPGLGRVRMQGMTDIYTPLSVGQGGRTVLRGDHGGFFWPQDAARSGSLVRLVWTDFDRWEWRNLTLPTDAVLRGAFEMSIPTAQAYRPQLTLDQPQLQLLVGRQLVQPLVVGPGGVVEPETVQTTSDAPPAENPTLSTAEFQARRQLIQKVAGPTGPNRPLQLFGWLNQGPAIELDRQTQRVSRTLLVMPLTLHPPKPGQTVYLPSALLSYDIYRHRGRGGFVTAFDPQHREWIALTQAGQVQVTFKLPEVVSPLRLQSLELQLDIDANGRTVDVRPQGGKASAGQSLESPMRTQTLSFDAADLPARPVGEVVFRINVSGPQDPMSMSTWQIQDIRLSVQGVYTLDANQGSDQP